MYSLRKLYLTCCLFLSCVCIFAQQNRIDSLQIILTNHHQEDTNKVSLLVDLAYAYQSINPDSVLSLSKQAYQLSEKLSYPKGQAWAMHRAGNASWMKANYPAAMEHTLVALRLFEGINDKKGIANCYNLIANTHNMDKNYEKAMEYYFKSIEIFEQLGDKFSIGRAYSNIGRTYYVQNNYPEAITYLEKALSILGALQEKNIYAAALNTMGDVQQKLGDYQVALSYYFQSLAISEPLNIKRIITYSTRGISEVYQLQGKYKESNEFAKRTMDIAKEIGYRENVKNAAFILSANYKSLGDYQQSLWYYTLGSVEKDSMFNAEKERQIETLRSNYELEKQQKEISLLTKEQQLQKKENNTLILFIVVILLILLILYLQLHWTRRDKRLLLEQKQLLQQQKEEIRTINDHLEEIVADRTYELSKTIENLTKQNQDLQQFSYITSHNLRAPVARILGLLNIFNQEDMNDEFNKQLLLHLRTASVSLDEVIKDLTNILSINKTVIVKERLKISEVVTSELAHLEEQVSASNALIKTNFTEIDNIYAIKVYIQSIVHNLLSNAIKYRSPNRNPLIEINTKLQNNHVCIYFKDNGLGFDTKDSYKIFGLYQRMHTHVEGKGMGLYMVKTQVEAMNGRIEVESKPNEGTTFKIYISYN